jgi:hypothetical protein
MRWVMIVTVALVAFVGLVVAAGAMLPRSHMARRSPFEIREAVQPRRLVTEIVDASMFGGTWTYDIVPETAGTVLTITENGWVSNPVFRLVAKYGFGHHATMDAYLKDLAARFDERAELFGE